MGSTSMLHPEPPQLNTPRRTIFTDDTSGNLTGKSFSRNCSAADRRPSSPSTNSARSGRGELSNTRLKRAETDLLVIDPSFTVRACASSADRLSDFFVRRRFIAGELHQSRSRILRISICISVSTRRHGQSIHVPRLLHLALFFQHLTKPISNCPRLAQQPRRSQKLHRSQVFAAMEFRPSHSRPCQRDQSHRRKRRRPQPIQFPRIELSSNVVEHLLRIVLSLA